MRANALLAGILVSAALVRPASAQLQEMRQIIFGMD